MFQGHEPGQQIPSSSSPAPPDHFQGVPEFLMRRSESNSGLDRTGEPDDDDVSEDSGGGGREKKRRLKVEQVKALEKSFESGSKLDPDRKIQLARDLGLQARQVAIWFQNRRARWKTKKLEKDYDVLKRQFESLKADNDALKSRNSNLHSQLLALRGRSSSSGSMNLNLDNEGCSWSNRSDGNVKIQTTPALTDNTIYRSNNNSNKHPIVFPSSSVGPGSAPLPSRPASSNEPFCNMFEENQDFWLWPQQHNFR